MGAEGCTPSATPIWGPKAARQALRSSRALGGGLGTTLGFYFVLSPAGAGLTHYWCAIKIFCFVFCRKRQKTKPGPAPTGSASANCVQAQNVENTKRFGIFFESLVCVACHVILEWHSLLHFLQLLVVMMYPTNLDGDVLKTWMWQCHGIA